MRYHWGQCIDVGLAQVVRDGRERLLWWRVLSIN